MICVTVPVAVAPAPGNVTRAGCPSCTFAASASAMLAVTASWLGLAITMKPVPDDVADVDDAAFEPVPLVVPLVFDERAAGGHLPHLVRHREHLPVLRGDQRGLVDAALGGVDRALRAVHVRLGLGDLLGGLRVQVGLRGELGGLDVALRRRHLRLGRVDRLVVVQQGVLLVLLRGGDGLLVGEQGGGPRCSSRW